LGAYTKLLMPAANPRLTPRAFLFFWPLARCEPFQRPFLLGMTMDETLGRFERIIDLFLSGKLPRMNHARHIAIANLLRRIPHGRELMHLGLQVTATRAGVPGKYSREVTDLYWEQLNGELPREEELADAQVITALQITVSLCRQVPGDSIPEQIRKAVRQALLVSLRNAKSAARRRNQ
jgi:hypothetical protein